jgi:hypothetical protein
MKNYNYEENDLMQLDKLTIESVKGDLEVFLPEKYMPSKITDSTIQTYKNAIKKAIKDDDGSKATLAGSGGIDNAEAYQFYAEFGVYAVACEAHPDHEEEIYKLTIQKK